MVGEDRGSVEAWRSQRQLTPWACLSRPKRTSGWQSPAARSALDTALSVVIWCYYVSTRDSVARSALLAQAPPVAPR